MITWSAFAEPQSAARFIDDEHVSLGGAQVGTQVVAHVCKVNKGATNGVGPEVVGLIPELGQMFFMCFQHIIKHCLYFIRLRSQWIYQQGLIGRLTVSMYCGFDG